MNIDLRYRLHQAWHWGTLGILLPILSLLILEIGLSLAQLSLFFAAYAAGTILTELPTGGLADRYGRIFIYRCSLIITILAFLLLALTKNDLILLFGAFFAGAGRAMGSGTVESWYAEQLKKAGRDDLHAALGKTGMWIAVGLAMGTLLGGGLPQLMQHWLVFDNIYLLNLYVVLVSYLLLLLFTPLFYREGEKGLTQPAVEDREAFYAPVWNAIRHCWMLQVVRFLILAKLLLGFCLMPVETYWQPMFEQHLGVFADQKVWFGILAMMYFAADALGHACSNKVVTLLRGRVGLTLYLSFALAGLSILLASLSHNLWLFCLGYLMFMVCVGVISPLVSAQLHKQVKDSYRASALSMLSLTLQLGSITASLSIVWLVAQWGIGASWLLPAFFALLLALFLLKLDRTTTQVNPE